MKTKTLKTKQKMDVYQYLKSKFWKLREDHKITSVQADLYDCLLMISNSGKGWKVSFKKTNNCICSLLNSTEKTLIKHREYLQKIGLIQYSRGGDGKEITYEIVALSDLFMTENGINHTGKIPVKTPVMEVKTGEITGKIPVMESTIHSIKNIIYRGDTEVLPLPHSEDEIKSTQKSTPVKIVKTVLERFEEFKKQVLLYEGEYSLSTLKEFITHWGEYNPGEENSVTALMAWEKNKKKKGTFNISSRLSTWVNNNKKWGKNNDQGSGKSSLKNLNRD